MNFRTVSRDASCNSVPDLYEPYALTANNRVDLLVAQVLRYTFFIKSESYMEKWTGLLGPSGNPRKK